MTNHFIKLTDYEASAIVYINVNDIVYFNEHFSDATKFKTRLWTDVRVVRAGSTYNIPVMESPEEIMKLIQEPEVKRLVKELEDENHRLMHDMAFINSAITH